jgi:predicted Ser/Thr protein kinase
LSVSAACPVCAKPVPVDVHACPECGTGLLDESEKTATRVDAMLGMKLGDYQVVSWLGMGGMGIVYEGLQPMIGKRVAIKVIRPEFAATEVQQLIDEARTVNAIGHRGVVDIFGSGKLPDGRQYLVMEYLNGRPLDAVVNEQAPMPAHEVVAILEEIVEVLSEVHAAGVVHRDLKPGNIFLVQSGRATGGTYLKILDFGIAKQLPVGGVSGQTRSSHIVGTPEYIAPEQAQGRTATPASDLYAVGIIAFEMLTGRQPFTANSVIELMMRHIDTPAPAPSTLQSSVPPALDELVLALLAKAPSARPTGPLVKAKLKQIKKELQDNLTSVGVKQPLPAEDRPAFEPRNSTMVVGAAPKPSRPVALIAAVAAVAVLGVGGLIFASTRSQPASPAVLVPAPPIAKPPPVEVPPAPVVVAAVEPPPKPAEPVKPVKVPGPKKILPATLQLLPSRVTGEVIIDGKSEGNLPRPLLLLSPGTHEVRVQNPVLGVFTKKLVVKSGEAVELRITRDDFTR